MMRPCLQGFALHRFKERQTERRRRGNNRGSGQHSTNHATAAARDTNHYNKVGGKGMRERGDHCSPMRPANQMGGSGSLPTPAAPRASFSSIIPGSRTWCHLYRMCRWLSPRTAIYFASTGIPKLSFSCDNTTSILCVSHRHRTPLLVACFQLWYYGQLFLVSRSLKEKVFLDNRVPARHKKKGATTNKK